MVSERGTYVPLVRAYVRVGGRAAVEQALITPGRTTEQLPLPLLVVVVVIVVAVVVVVVVVVVVLLVVVVVVVLTTCTTRVRDFPLRFIAEKKEEEEKKKKGNEDCDTSETERTAWRSSPNPIDWYEWSGTRTLLEFADGTNVQQRRRRPPAKKKNKLT